MSWYENPMSPLNLGAYSTPVVNRLAAYGTSGIPTVSGLARSLPVTGLDPNAIASTLRSTASGLGGAAEAPGGYSLLSRLASAGAANAPSIGTAVAEEAPQLGWLAAQGGLKGLAGSTLPYAIPGMVGGGLIQAVGPKGPGTASSVTDVLANAAKGAGIGAAVGNVIPIPGVGAGVGALAGAGLGAGATVLGNIFGGQENKPQGSLRDTIGATAKAYGYNEDVYKQRFDLAVKAGAKDAQGNPIPQEAIAQSMADQLIAQHQGEVQNKEQAAWQQAQHQADLQAGLALQSQAREFFSPYTNNIIASGQSQADVLNHLASQVPGAYKGVFQAQAASALNNAQQMAGAYAAQTALMPAQMAMAQTAQANSADIANQAKLFQYASQMMGRQGAGGGTDLVSQLQQAGGQYNAQPG